MARLATGLAVVCAAWMTWAAPAVAQDEPAEAAETTVAEAPAKPAELLAAEQLWKTIETTSTEARELREKWETTEGDQRRFAVRAYEKAIVAVVQDSEALVDALEAADKAGVDVSAVRKPFLKALERSIEGAVELTAQADAMVDKLSSTRDDIADGELVEFERSVNRRRDNANRLYDLAKRHFGTIGRAGIDTAKAQELFAERLTDRAENLVTRLEVAEDGKVVKDSKVSASPDDAVAKGEAEAAQMRVDGIVASLDKTAELLGELGEDASVYEGIVLQSTGQITTDALDAKVVAGLVEQWSDQAWQWLVDHGPGWILKVVLFIVILFVFRMLSKATNKVVDRGFASSKVPVSNLLREMVTSLASRGVMILGLLIALSQVGIDLAPLLAGLGVAGFVIGFALQDSLSNFAAGAMILFYRPFDVGDVVDVAGGVFGTVNHMTLVSTTILTFDNQTLVVPNSKIWGGVIKNVTSQQRRRVDLMFGIGYDDEIPKAERILAEIVDGHDKILKEPAPVIKLHELADSSVNFIVRPWCNTADYWDVFWDLTREVKVRFDAEGIGIPFPQRDVHLYVQGKDAALPIAEDG